MVGKRALHKDFWMEVRKSRARFISIFCIVALGVAFFSGIQASSPDMRLSGDAYYNESKLMDLKVVGTMGLTDDDIQALKELPETDTVEGAYSTDVICGETDSQKVLHVESLNKEVNHLSITEGRLPQKSGECFLDSAFASGQKYSIGDKVVIRQPGDSELLKEETYTVVGIGKSPLYISFNRGNTTVGSGEVNGFMYVVADDFDSDVYTQIYVRAHEVDKVTSYTDGYDNLADKLEDKVKGIEAERCQARYDSVVGEAQEKIEDAEKELADGKKEADEELADAKKKLDDGEQELTDGEKEYEDGKQQLADARQELEDGKKQLADAKQKIADGRSQIASARQQVADGQAQIATAQKKLDEGWNQYNDGKKKYNAGKKKLDAAKKELEDGKKQIAAGKAELEQKQQELNAGIAQIQEGQQAVETQLAQLQEQIPQIEAGIGQLQAAVEGLEAAQNAVAQLEAAVQEKQSAVEAAQAARDEAAQKVENGELTEEELAGYEQALAQAQAELEAVNGALAQAQESLNACQQAAAQKTELEANLSAANAGVETLQAKKTELAQTLENLSANQTAIDEGKAKLNEEEAKLGPAEKEIAANEKTLKDSKKKLDASLKKLQDGQAEIDANKAKMNSALAEIEANEQKLNSGEAEIAANEQKLVDGEREIQENEQKLKDAEKELEDARKELADGKKEYEDGKKEAEDKIKDGQEKIDDAKKELTDLKYPEWILTDRNGLPEYSDYGDNADRIKNIGEVFPVIFFLVAALISLTTMTRMVEEQRTQIGTMKALGYSKISIASKYLNYAFLATAGGSVAGILIGEKIIPFVIIKSYGIMYHNVENTLQIHYELKYALLASVAALICTVGATIFSCVHALAETPASLMRPPTPKEGKRILLERIPILWKHLNFTWKSSLRNLFRYKKRLFMTVSGILGCTALLVVGMAIKNSVTDLMPKQYEHISRYDLMAVTIADDFDNFTNQISSDDQIQDYLSLQTDSIQVVNDSSEETIPLYIIPDDAPIEDYIRLEALDGSERELSDADILITQNLSEVMDFSVGDDLHIQNSNLEECDFPISGIVRNYLGNAIYIRQSRYEALIGSGSYAANSILAHLSDSCTDPVAYADQLSRESDVVSCNSVQAMRDEFSKSFGLINCVVVLVTALAAGLAFVVLFTLATTNISERERELATIKVLGFFDKEVHSYVNKETLILTVIGILLGLPVGRFFSGLLTSVLKMPSIYFAVSVHPSTYLFAGGMTFLFALAVDLITNRLLDHINMVDALKSVE